ncbi:MAG: phytanoyl-CoA dioxygenase family protein [Alphaproteobacteria bacterium]
MSRTTDALPRPSRDPATLKSHLDTFGYCLIKEALAPAQLAAMRARLEEQAEAERALGDVNHDPAEDQANINQWVYMLINKGAVFRDTLLHPAAQELVRHVLGPDYLLSSFAAHITHPGGALMAMHTDQWWMPPPAQPGGAYARAGAVGRSDGRGTAPLPANTAISPPVVVNIMWMINDFTEANGATRIVPRSHATGLQPDSRTPHRMESVPAAAPAGTALVWEGRTWHSAGLNVSHGPRLGIQTSYCGPQFRPMENYTLGLRPEVLADLPAELLPILGFKIWSGYGNTGEMGAIFAQPGSALLGELKLGESKPPR